MNPASGFPAGGDHWEEVGDCHPVLLGTGADPWMVRHGGWYYLCVTTGRDVTIRRARSISGIAGGEPRVVWTPPAHGPGSANLWAPELHRLGDAWYLYVAADDGRNEEHRVLVLENRADDPCTGRFILKGRLADPRADHWAIDATILVLGDRRYALWSGWEGSENVSQQLYIAPLADPWTISGDRVVLSRPEHPWECHGRPLVNEGPQVAVRGSTINLLYSASGSWTDHYCLGLLTASTGADPLDPRSWTKHPVPVLASGHGIVAPGHASLVESPDGRESWIIYHAAHHPGSGWARSIRAQPFTWSADGTPRFGAPQGGQGPIPLPSGEPARWRIPALRGHLGGAARQVAGGPGGLPLVELQPGSDGLEVPCRIAHGGPQLFVIHAATRSVSGPMPRLALSLDGRPKDEVVLPHTGEDGWTCTHHRIELAPGDHLLRLAAVAGPVWLDAIDRMAVAE